MLSLKRRLDLLDCSSLTTFIYGYGIFNGLVNLLDPFDLLLLDSLVAVFPSWLLSRRLLPNMKPYGDWVRCY